MPLKALAPVLRLARARRRGAGLRPVATRAFSALAGTVRARALGIRKIVRRVASGRLHAIDLQRRLRGI